MVNTTTKVVKNSVDHDDLFHTVKVSPDGSKKTVSKTNL